MKTESAQKIITDFILNNADLVDARTLNKVKIGADEDITLAALWQIHSRSLPNKEKKVVENQSFKAYKRDTHHLKTLLDPKGTGGNSQSAYEWYTTGK